MSNCTKLHGNPSSSRQDMSLKSKNVNLLEAVEGKSGDHQSQQDSGGTMCVCTKDLNILSINDVLRDSVWCLTDVFPCSLLRFGHF